MDIKDKFKAYLWADPLSGITDEVAGEDITSGILNVNIVSGNDIYEGPQQQIDTGEFTIVSRNPNLDPKINTNLKYNSRIVFYGKEDEVLTPFFTGYVTSINVEYVRNDNPIITISGTDIFGVLQRILVNQTLYNEIIALSTGGSWDGVDFLTFVSQPEIYNLFSSKYWSVLDLNNAITSGEPTGPQGANGFLFSGGAYQYNVSDQDQWQEGYMGLQEAKYIPEVGETLLEVINKYCSTNLNTLEYAPGFGQEADFIIVYPFAKYDYRYWYLQQDPSLQYPNYNFSSDPEDNKPYESILLSNGFDRVINQIEVSNEYRTLSGTEIVSNTDNFSKKSDASIEDYAVSKLNISTIFPDSADPSLNNMVTRFTKSIFQIVASPSDQIQKITIDNARHNDLNNFNRIYYKLNQIIRIKHELNNTETIDRFYDIAGISHDISPDKWETTFTVKPSIQEVVFNYQGYQPVIQLNSTTGDSNFNFTATIVDYPTDEILAVLWCLNATETYDGIIDESMYYWASTNNGERYKDLTTPSGLTQTWNFDDDGILRVYDVTGNSGALNYFGRYGTGHYTIYAYIILKNGFVVVAQNGVTVNTPEVTADFVWNQNLTNNFGQVTFTGTSVNNENGEVDSYAWDFGDGTTSSQQNPIHVYNPGPNDTEYEVSLTVFAYGEGEVKVPNTHTETVTLEQPAMTADYTFNQTDDTSIVTFTNTSTNVGFEEADAYFWEFDDGTTSTLKSPVHTFPASENVPITYSVSLTIRNIWEQTESVTKSVEVLSLNDAGSLSVSNLRLTIDNFDTVTPSPNYPKYPYMIFLRARTSFTQANLIYLASTSRTGTTSNIIWYEADGTTAEAGDPFNLTRNPNITPTSQYGLSPWINNITTQSTKFVLNTAVNNSQNIKNIQMTLRDVDGSGSGGATQNPIVNVDVPDSFGGYVNIGYFKVPAGKINPSAPYNTVSEGLKTMVARRPMPPNIPYFKYTFNNTIASFTSVETADSYAWDFGDGTTSTDKDPVHTFPSRGTYNVTLEVTNDAVVTRTTTEPVIVEALVPFDIRYVKFEQDEHDGTHAFDTPWLTNFTMRNIQDSLNTYIIYTPGAPYNELQVSKTVAKQDFYSMEYTPVDGSFSFDPTTNPYWFWLINSDNGLRAKSLDAGFLTEWNLICDFKQAWKNVSDFTVDAGKSSISPNPTVAAGISYSIYVTDHTGPTINPGAVTWTKVGNITPTALVEGQTKYSLVVI